MSSPPVPVNRLGTAEPVTLRAGVAVALRVRAVVAEGKPLVGARVTLVNGQPGLDRSFEWGYHDASWEDMVRGRTGVDGWADFPALSFGGATVLVQAPGCARHRISWRNGQKELTVELAPEAVVAGEVRGATGEPVRAFHIDLTFGGDQISASVVPDDRGRFRIAELPSGVWTLTIRSAQDHSMLHHEQIPLKVGEMKELKIETKKE